VHLLEVLEATIPDPYQPSSASAEADGYESLEATPDGDESSPDPDRSEAIAVLDSVIEMIEAVAPALGVSPGVARPLRQVRNGLCQLNFGVAIPMLQPTKLKGGRPPDSMPRKFLRGLAVGTMSALMDVGLTRRDAANRVAAALQKKNLKGVNWKRVAQWRDQVKRAIPLVRPRRGSVGAPESYPTVHAYQSTTSTKHARIGKLRRAGLLNDAALNRYIEDRLEKFGEIVEELRLVKS
jgi:hypothetical protein